MNWLTRRFSSMRTLALLAPALTFAALPAHAATLTNFFTGVIPIGNGDVSSFFNTNGEPLAGVCYLLDTEPPGEILGAPAGTTLGLNESPSSTEATIDSLLHPSGFNQRAIMSAYNPNI